MHRAGIDVPVKQGGHQYCQHNKSHGVSCVLSHRPLSFSARSPAGLRGLFGGQLIEVVELIRVLGVVDNGGNVLDHGGHVVGRLPVVLLDAPDVALLDGLLSAR